MVASPLPLPPLPPLPPPPPLPLSPHPRPFLPSSLQSLPQATVNVGKDVLWQFNFTSVSWKVFPTTGSPDSRARVESCSWMHANTLYMFGGKLVAVPGSPQSIVSGLYALNLSVTPYTWVRVSLPGEPTGRYGHGAAGIFD
jgi:hypothetical protein